MPKEEVMKPRIITIGAIASLLLCVSFFAGCHHHSGSHEVRAEKMIRFLTDELSLSESQQEMLVTFKDEMFKKRAEARRNRQKNKTVMMEELKKDTIDQERLLNIYIDQKPKMDETVTFIISSLAEFHASLTSEQKSILIDKLERLDKWHSYFAD